MATNRVKSFFRVGNQYAECEKIIIREVKVSVLSLVNLYLKLV